MRRRHGCMLLALALGACAAAPAVPPAREAAVPAERMAAQSLPPWGGTRWAAPTAGNGQSTPRLEFAENGELHGYTGCNMLAGHWSEDSGEIRFSKLIVTKRFCVGEGSEIEKRLLAALSAESRGRREGGKLVISSPQGATFEFTPAAAA